MTKLTRKLFISILTVAFAFVTLGATTFAWFTLTTTAKVDTFNASMQSGTGIEMSLDGGFSYKNYFSKEEILEAITNSTTGTITFNLVTSFNGVDMYRHTNLYIENAAAASGYGDWGLDEDIASDYITFDVWFRSPTEGARIYLLTDTKTGLAKDSLGNPINNKLWQPDGTFFYGGEEEITKNTDPFNVYLADTLRMSFQKFSLTNDEDDEDSLIKGDSEGVVIYELDPTIADRPALNEENFRLDTEVVINLGMVEYYNFKNENKQINTQLIGYVNEALPKTIYDNDHLVVDLEKVDAGEEHADAPVLLVLTAEKGTFDGYYYGYMEVRVWAEGWDPDAFNAVLGSSLSIDFAFGGADPE